MVAHSKHVFTNKTRKNHNIQHGGVDFKKIAFLAAATILKLVGNVASIDSVKEIRSNLSQQSQYADLNASIQETFIDLYGDARCNPSDMAQYSIKRDLAQEQVKILEQNKQAQAHAFFQPAGQFTSINNYQSEFEQTPAMWNMHPSHFQDRGTSIMHNKNVSQTNKKRKHRKNNSASIKQNINIQSHVTPPNPFAIFEENKFKLDNCNIIATEFNTNLNAFIRLVKETTELEIDEYIKNLEHQIKTLNDQINQSKQSTQYVQFIPPILTSMNEIYKLIKLKLRDLSAAYETSARTRGISTKEKQILLLANKIIMDHFKTSGIININNQPIQNITRLAPIASVSQGMSDMDIDINSSTPILPVDVETNQVANRRAIIQSILGSSDNRLISNAYVQYDVNAPDSDVDIFGRSRPRTMTNTYNRMLFKSQNKTKKSRFHKTKKSGKTSKITTHRLKSSNKKSRKSSNASGSKSI